MEIGYTNSPRTVMNLMERLVYHKQIPRRKFSIWPANKPKRVAWGQQTLDWTLEAWSQVVWTDESTFSTTGFSHPLLVIRLTKQEFHIHCIDQNFQQGTDTTMACGVFCGTIKSDLVFIPRKVKMDSASMLRPLCSPIWCLSGRSAVRSRDGHG